MSRIGKSPVHIPEKVSVDIKGLSITVKGPKGELKRLMPEGVNFDQKENQIVVTPATTKSCLLYTSPSPRDATLSRMPSSA